MTHRLATSPNFAARISACVLLPTVSRFAGGGDQRAALRRAYGLLCGDEHPMVRRAAAHKLQDIVGVCDRQDALADLVPVYVLLSKEGRQDAIRVASMAAAPTLVRVLGKEGGRQHALPVIMDASKDPAWTVRLSVAMHLDRVCAAFGPEIMDSDLIQILMQLTRDREEEVRKEAVGAIVRLENPLTSEQFEQHLLPELQPLGQDAGDSVRMALAQLLGPLVTALGQQLTRSHLVGLFIDLLKDECHDVRLNAVPHLHHIISEISNGGSCKNNSVHKLIAELPGIRADSNWRVRECLVPELEKLASLLPEFFEAKIEPLYLESLRDPVHSVRAAAIQHIEKIVAIFGAEWAAEYFLPKLIDLQSQTSSGYVERITILNLLPKIAGEIMPQQVMEYLVPQVVQATKDRVPNVRLCACRTILSMLQQQTFDSAAVDRSIRPCLVRLVGDADGDVRYRAQMALALCAA